MEHTHLFVDEGLQWFELQLSLVYLRLILGPGLEHEHRR